jgi:anti-anti-sigma factor
MLEEPAALLQPVGIYFLPGATLIRLHGPFTAAAGTLTEDHPVDVEALARGLAASGQPVVVNVAAVTEMDTEGLRWLMRLTGRVRRQGAGLILESPTLCVEEVLTLTGCHTWFSAATRPGPDAREHTVELIKTLPA